jgi:tetratricopeptide (TPR) repeat protein
MVHRDEMTAEPALAIEPAGGRDPVARRYSAFISYTDADRALALRLQSRIERYRLPARLARQVGYSRLKPVFVDRSEMGAAPDLGDAIRQALGRSEYLIVLCTPRTPGSHWVGREIDTFRELRGGANILVALFEGHKADCFHPRLLAGGDTEPLAADFRPGGDGHRLALLKVVAALVGVDLDELVHRDGKRQRRRTAGIGSAVAAIVLTIAALSVWAWSADRAVDRGRAQASRAMTRQLDVLRDKIKAGGTLDMAAAVNRNVELFYDELPPSGLPEVEMGRAKLLQAKADDAQRRGDPDSAAADARAAWNTSAAVLRKRPDDPNAIFVHAQSAYWVGAAALLRRDTPLAAGAFARYADLADRLVKTAPGNEDYRLEQGYAYSNLGTIALREARDPNRAERYFSAAQAAFREVAQRRPDDLDAIYEVEDGESWLADVELFRRNFKAAQGHRDEQARLLNRLLQREPRDQRFRIDHLTSQIGQARLYSAQGRYRAALERLRLAQEEASALSADDPQDASAASRKRAIELFQAQNQLDLADSSTARNAQRLVGDCSNDWAVRSKTELPAFCSILAARVALEHGDPASAKRIMADPRLASWLSSPSLSPTWRLDLPAECRKLGDPELCA